MATDRQRFSTDGADYADNAGTFNWWRQILGKPLAKQMKLVATDVTVVIVKNSGHWILEEQPKQTTDALLNFL